MSQESFEKLCTELRPHNQISTFNSEQSLTVFAVAVKIFTFCFYFRKIFASCLFNKAT